MLQTCSSSGRSRVARHHDDVSERPGDMRAQAMDRTIYCDADSLWLSDAAALWAEFDTMEESVLFGMSIENEEPEGRCHWYSEGARGRVQG